MSDYIDSVSEDDKVNVKQDIKVKEEVFVEVEKVKVEFSTGGILSCSICGDICKRAVLTRCCQATACRACAIKTITMVRECWVGSCRTVGVATKDLDNDDVMRQAVDQYKDNGQVDQGLLEELKGRLIKESEYKEMDIKEELHIKDEKEDKVKIGEYSDTNYQKSIQNVPEQGVLQNCKEEKLSRKEYFKAKKEKKREKNRMRRRKGREKNDERDNAIQGTGGNPEGTGGIPEKLVNKCYACQETNCTEIFQTWGLARRHMKNCYLGKFEINMTGKGLLRGNLYDIAKCREKAENLQRMGSTVSADTDTTSIQTQGSEDKLIEAARNFYAQDLDKSHYPPPRVVVRHLRETYGGFGIAPARIHQIVKNLSKTS